VYEAGEAVGETDNSAGLLTTLVCGVSIASVAWGAAGSGLGRRRQQKKRIMQIISDPEAVPTPIPASAAGERLPLLLGVLGLF
jgi:hypothetical protein